MGPPSLNGGNFGAQIVEPPFDFSASMGPPSLNGGNQQPLHALQDALDASMGPPSLNGGNSIRTEPRKFCRLQLQWGRRLSTAEMFQDWTRPDRTGEASMGPPSLNGGNPGGSGMSATEH